jgi:predicted branched-subunit amino acid permease
MQRFSSLAVIIGTVVFANVFVLVVAIKGLPPVFGQVFAVVVFAGHAPTSFASR